MIDNLTLFIGCGILGEGSLRSQKVLDLLQSDSGVLGSQPDDFFLYLIQLRLESSQPVTDHSDSHITILQSRHQVIDLVLQLRLVGFQCGKLIAFDILSFIKHLGKSLDEIVIGHEGIDRLNNDAFQPILRVSFSVAMPVLATRAFTKVVMITSSTLGGSAIANNHFANILPILQTGTHEETSLEAWDAGKEVPC